MRCRDSKTIALRFLALGFLLSTWAQTHAEVRDVSVTEVLKEFCAVIVANEARYTELLEGCFPDASQSTETRAQCVAIHNSIFQVVNAFSELRQSPEVEVHYHVPFDWEPPAEAFARLNCERSEDPYMPGEWGCVGFRKDEVPIASREPICADAMKAEDRIDDLLANGRLASLLLQVRALRAVPAEPSPVVEPHWSISD